MKKFIIASMVAVLAGLGSAAWAEPGEGPGPRAGQMGPGKEHAMGGRMIQRLLDNPEKAQELGITPEQATALQASFLDLEKKMVTLQSEVELAQIEVRRLMNDDSADEAALMAAIDKAGLARTAVQKAAAEQRLAVRKIVSPETLKKIKGLVGERMRQARGGEGDEPMQGPRGDGKRDGKGNGKDAPWKKGPMAPPSEE